MIQDFPARLKFFRAKNNLSQAELAKLIGISGKQVSDYEVGTSKPRQSTYFKILDALGVSDEVFCLQPISTQNNAPSILKIPLVSWMEVLTIKSEFMEFDSHIYIDSNTLNRKSPEGLFAMKVMGLSMYPDYKDGDLILVDSFQDNIEDGLLYILSTGEESAFKQCFKQPNGMLNLSTLNNTFPSFEVSPDCINVIGRVVFKMGFV